METMQKRRLMLAELLAVMTIGVTGCHSTRQKSPEQFVQAPSLTAYNEVFAYMKDNAMQHVASISDLHFVPHTTELNGLGVAYLDRLALLHDPYGGTVRYSTTSTDEAFVATRLAHLTDYLEAIGADTTRITVVAAMPGGRGMRADQALVILAHNNVDEETIDAVKLTQ